MKNVPFVPIDTVLFDVSTTLPEEHYNPLILKEWAVKGLRKLKFRSMLQQEVALVPLLEHKAKLPADVKYINQVVYYSASATNTNVTVTDLQRWLGLNTILLGTTGVVSKTTTVNGLPLTTTSTVEASTIPDQILALAKKPSYWKPMTANTNDFMQSVTKFTQDTTHLCEHSYTIDPSFCLTSTLKDGSLMVSYMKYTQDANGNILIPDNEDLKDALFHFCMYRYWMTKKTALEQGAREERDWHLAQFQVLAAKATGDENLPEASRYENLLRMNSLIPNSRSFLDSFQDLSRE